MAACVQFSYEPLHLAWRANVVDTARFDGFTRSGGELTVLDYLSIVLMKGHLAKSDFMLRAGKVVTVDLVRRTLLNISKMIREVIRGEGQVNSDSVPCPCGSLFLESVFTDYVCGKTALRIVHHLAHALCPPSIHIDGCPPLKCYKTQTSVDFDATLLNCLATGTQTVILKAVLRRAFKNSHHCVGGISTESRSKKLLLRTALVGVSEIISSAIFYPLFRAQVIAAHNQVVHLADAHLEVASPEALSLQSSTARCTRPSLWTSLSSAPSRLHEQSERVERQCYSSPLCDSDQGEHSPESPSIHKVLVRQIINGGPLSIYRHYWQFARGRVLRTSILDLMTTASFRHACNNSHGQYQ
eukprot:Lankesteria_metandrocarpae@DN2678_c0_g1_i3.p1